VAGHDYENGTNTPLISTRPAASLSAYSVIAEVIMPRTKPPILAPNPYDPFEEEVRRLEIRPLSLA
jgi:hypothetical protein